MQDRVFPILDKSYATQAVRLWLLIIILVFYERNALRLLGICGGKPTFPRCLIRDRFFTIWCCSLCCIQSIVVDRLPQAEPSQF